MILKTKNGLAEVDFDGVKKDINVSLIDNLRAGDYVNVHAGFAIQKLTAKDAKEILKLYTGQIKRDVKRNDRQTD